MSKSILWRYHIIINVISNFNYFLFRSYLNLLFYFTKKNKLKQFEIKYKNFNSNYLTNDFHLTNPYRLTSEKCYNLSIYLLVNPKFIFFNAFLNSKLVISFILIKKKKIKNK